MRITMMRQQLKELVARAPNDDLTKLDAECERIKWYLWHGNVFRALQEIESVQWELEDCEEVVPASTKLAKTVREFRGYIEANEQFIPNYGERYRYGEAIATGFVEGAVNQVVSKRMVKKQQMRWTKKGAHLLLQVRSQVLNDDLRATFERWYPAIASTDVPPGNRCNRAAGRRDGASPAGERLARTGAHSRPQQTRSPGAGAGG